MEGVLKEGSISNAYELALCEIKFAMFRSAAWAERAFESVKSNESFMNVDQLLSLRTMLIKEQERMMRARMGVVRPDAAVWTETLIWLDARLEERQRV